MRSSLLLRYRNSYRPVPYGWMDGDMDVCMYSMYVCMYEGTPVRYGTVRKVCIDYAHARLMCSLQGANALTDGVES